MQNSLDSVFMPAIPFDLLKTTESKLSSSADTLNSESAGDENFPPLPSLPSPAAFSSRNVNPAWNARVEASLLKNSPCSKVAFTHLTGKCTERFEIPLHLQSKEQLGTKLSLTDVCKQVMKNTNTSIEVSTAAKTGTMTFLVSGKLEDAVLAKRQIQKEFCTHVTQTIQVPSIVRPSLVGTGGKNLKALTNKTLTKINIPRRQENEECDDSTVTISGDCEGVEMARKEIEGMIAIKTARKTVRISIEKSFHPLISGFNGLKLSELQQKTNTRIILSPMHGTQDQGQRNHNEVVISGLKDDVDAAHEIIRGVYEELRLTTKTLALPISKKTHKFIVGSKGVHLTQIFKETGCFVELPGQDDPSDLVVIRGPETRLSLALNLVLEKSSAVAIEEIVLNQFISKPKELSHFVKYLMLKDRATFSQIELDFQVSTQFYQNQSEWCLEVSSKDRMVVNAVKNKLVTHIKGLLSVLFFASVEIPRGLHRFLLGKNGASLEKLKLQPEFLGRLQDVIVPTESEETDDVILVIKRISGLERQKSDQECFEFTQVATEQVHKTAAFLADFVSIIIQIDPKYHGRIIGAGGNHLKDLIAPFEGRVSIRFMSSGSKNPLSSPEDQGLINRDISIKGPSKEVDELRKRVVALAEEWHMIDLENSYTKTVAVDKGTSSKIISASHNVLGIPWLLKALKDKAASDTSAFNQRDLTSPTFNLRFLTKEKFSALAEKCPDQPLHSLGQPQVATESVDTGLAHVDVQGDSDEHDFIIVMGPKAIVDFAIPLIEEKARIEQQTVYLEMDLFDEIDNEIVNQRKNDPKIRQKVMRRLIGKQGRTINKLIEKHCVSLHFEKQDASDLIKDIQRDANEVQIDGTLGKVSIKGLCEDVKRAQEELLSQAQYELLHTFVEQVTVPKSVIETVVKRSTKQLREEFDVRVETFEAKDDVVAQVYLEGSSDKVKLAKDKIVLLVDRELNASTKSVKIPLHLHRSIIGPSGNRIQKLIQEFGGGDLVRIEFPKSHHFVSQSDTVLHDDQGPKNAQTHLSPPVEQHAQFNEQSTNEQENAKLHQLKEHKQRAPDEIRITAHKNILDNVAQALYKIAEETIGFASNGEFVEHHFTIPQADVPKIVGKKGEKLKQLSAKYPVAVQLGEKVEDQATVICITGKGNEAQLEQVKQEILSNVSVDSQIDYSQLVEPLQMRMIELQLRKMRFPEVKLEFSSGIAHIRANSKIIEHASKRLLAKIEQMAKYYQELSTVLAFQPHLIGKQGATINKIREKTKALIEVDAEKSELKVFIKAKRSESLEAAVDSLNKIIKDQEQRLEKAALKEEKAKEEADSKKQERPKAAARIDQAKPMIPGWSGRKAAPVPVTASSSLPLVNGTVRVYNANDSVKASEWKTVKASRSRKQPLETVEAATVAADLASVTLKENFIMNANIIDALL